MSDSTVQISGLFIHFCSISKERMKEGREGRKGGREKVREAGKEEERKRERKEKKEKKITDLFWKLS